MRGFKAIALGLPKFSLEVGRKKSALQKGPDVDVTLFGCLKCACQCVGVEFAEKMILFWEISIKSDKSDVFILVHV